MLNLKDIIQALTLSQHLQMDVPIHAVVIDSRQAVPGSLFVALPGEHVNGHDYIGHAFSNGATLALIDQDITGDCNVCDLRPGFLQTQTGSFSLPLCIRVEDSLVALQKLAAYWREQNPVRTIGITGSVGKTSTKELTAALLSKKFKVLKNPGNRNNEIGLPLSLLELEKDHQCAVLEMGFYVPGEIRTLCEIAKPHVGVVTNIGTVHAQRAGSQEVIAKGKAELVQSLPEAPNGVAILNQDDSWVRKMIFQTKAKVLTYGTVEQADLQASDINVHGLEGISCTLTYQGQPHAVKSPLLGQFSLYTILRATAVALVEGVDWQTIQQGLSTSTVDLRMHPFNLSNGAVILDDTYNASPASTIAALELLGGFKGRRIAVLGDMLELGQYEVAGHQSVGEFAVSSADILILVGERSKVTAESALSHGFPADKLFWYADSSQATELLLTKIQKDDIVLIKGSNSMRMDRIITSIKEMF